MGYDPVYVYVGSSWVVNHCGTPWLAKMEVAGGSAELTLDVPLDAASLTRAVTEMGDMGVADLGVAGAGDISPERMIEVPARQRIHADAIRSAHALLSNPGP